MSGTKHNEPQEDNTGAPPTPAKQRRHLIKPKWLRVTLKTLMWIVVFVLMLPVLVYLPPVQDLAIKIAKEQVRKSTGMEIGIGKFRLRFPLDVLLKDVYVLTAQRDTMVKAGEAVVDIKLLPLLNLDVQVKRLDLKQGYYRMVSPDSSMIMAVRAGLLTVDDKSSVDISKMRILLNKVKLKDGDLALYMDQWKKKPTPEDTAKSTPIYIQANNLELDNFGFGMSMLPTIDTLDMRVKHVRLANGVVDLGKNVVQWRRAEVADGKVKYIAPTAEWVKAHPLPPSEPSTGPPMRIMGDSIAVENLAALYATKGVKPATGFDPAYISVTDVAIGMRGFYNESSTVKLPITRLRAKERSGLQIASGHGQIGIDSVGLTLKGVNINTLFSRIAANADVPFAVMGLDTRTPMAVKANGHIGMPDVEAFMPIVKTYTAKVPKRKPLNFDINASGTLAKLDIRRLKAEMAGVVSLDAKGYADNVLDFKRLQARVALEGALMDPSLAELFLADSQMKIPAFHIKGTAEAHGQSYGADLALTSTAGDVAAKGHVKITPEQYVCAVDATQLNVGAIMPSLGIGRVTAQVEAQGAGFNPLSGHAVTDAKVRVSGIEYKGMEYKDIRADVVLHGDGELQLLLSSANPGINLDLNGTGTIKPDYYAVNMEAQVRDLNLQMLGLSDSLCNGSGNIYLNGTAQPGKWLYDAELRVDNFDWNLPGRFIHLPAGMRAVVKTTDISTALDLYSLETNVRFRSPVGLEHLVTGFTATADTVMNQMKRKNIAVDGIRTAMPQFMLDLSASGRGLLAQFLGPDNIRLDTVWGHIERDSIISGQINALGLSTTSFQADTLGLTLKERGELLDYMARMGNRRGTMDEFANVRVQGYVGHNRLSAYMTQHNIKGEMGYRLGLTASMMDSVISVHFTPLKSTIAYMPWQMNSDNYIDYNFHNMHVDANLKASSAESSIMARTEKNADGNDQLRLKVENLHIQDFTSMFQNAPGIKGTVNTDLTVHYIENELKGDGSLSIGNLIYEKKVVGDLDVKVAGGYNVHSGAIDANATLKVDGREAMLAYAYMQGKGEQYAKTDSVGVRLTRFPLKVANAFLGDAAHLSGYISGNMKMDIDKDTPHLDGYVRMDSAQVTIPMAGATLRMDTVPITMEHNVLKLDKYDIWAANGNPLTLDGRVDATKFSNILVDLTANAKNMQLINSDKRSKADLYGKIFLNLGATARGPLSRLDIRGDLNLLGETDATYRLNMSPSELQTTDQNVVQFVNFNDSTEVQTADTVAESALNMRINANLTISSGTKLQVLLSTNGTDKVELEPTANLHYTQNYQGDMNMTGTLTLGNGFVRYAVPVIGEKMFDFNPSSTITWTGNVVNPTLNVTATDKMKANVTTDGNSRLVNFLVTLYATNPVDQLKVAFDLSTNDDLALQNELQSMSADQRQTQAMNLLLYGQYQGAGGTKANAKLGGNMLYSFLESQINSWAAKNIRGVDLSFGVNQYEKSVNGSKSTETSYSYQVSKSLFNNRFKIQVGGNYSTDQSAEDNLAQNLVSDISFEYIIKQTATQNMSVQLFRRQNYESILEGEITETGVAFVLKRKLGNMLRLFSKKKKKKSGTATGVDTVTLPVRQTTEQDTNILEKK